MNSSWTRLKGVSGKSQADKSISFQGGSRLGPTSCCGGGGGGEVGFRILDVGETGGGSGTAMLLKSSVWFPPFQLPDRACTLLCFPQSLACLPPLP